MSVKAKDQIGGDLCKSHAARCDKDFLRVCPSKLSKRELEDVYYSLLENNLELKKAVNSQNEKIRMLTTKVQRMATQTRTYSKDPKDCCAGAKAVISEQKASIADLKKANDCMAERIRHLNMRLCTAKQFLRRSPNQCSNKCFNCISRASTSVKNLSTSALHDKSDDITNLRTVALSARSVAKISPPTRTIETNTPEVPNVEKVDTEKVCDENKCRSTMEEFKQKIVDLQEQLSRTHLEYSTRMCQLEDQVGALRAAEDTRPPVRAHSSTAELETQLKLERAKVAELEMRLKSADMSQEVAKTIEKHLTKVSQLEEKQRVSRIDSERCNICVSPLFTSNEASPKALPTTSKRLSELMVPDDKHSKSEDSGYAEHNRDSDRNGSIDSANRELLQRVTHLQAQVDALKSIEDNPDQSPTSIRKSIDFKSYDVVLDESDVPKLKNIKNYDCLILDPTKKVIVEIKNVNKDSPDEEPLYSSLNSPKKETEQLTESQEPTSSKEHRESILSRRQSRFGPEINQERSNKEIQDLTQSTRLKTIIVPELDEALRRSTDESKPFGFYRNDRDTSGFNDTGIRNNNNPKTMTVQRQQVTLEENDKKLASHHTIYKNDIQDDISHSKQNDEANNLPQKVKVHCHCPKCKDNVENSVPKRLSHEIDDDTYPYLQCDKEQSDDKASATKRVSDQVLESKLPLRVLQESMPPRPTLDASVSEDKTYQRPVKPKLDRHNSLQIPGPLPVDQRDSWGRKISKASAKSVFLPENRSTHFKTVGITINDGITSVNDQTDATKEENVGVKMQGEGVPGVLIGKTAGNAFFSDLDSRQAVLSHMPIDFGDSAGKETQNQVTEKKLSFEPNVKQVNDFDTATYSRETNVIKETQLTGENNITGEEERLHHRFPETKIPVLRRASTCKPVEPGRALTQSPGHTYTVPESPVGYKSRTSTPENTDNEISVMTDLPTERDGTTPRDVLSPGEYKATTTTYTDSYTPAHEQTLSEGEVPNGTNYPKRTTSISVGEYPGDKRLNDINPCNQDTSAQRMEAALQAISQELARCRSLLHSQRPREQRPATREAATTAELTRKDSITLRKAEGKPRLSGGVSPKCNFTLHVGTIVLSDEAVINSRDKPLVLSWKFYDQNMTMTRISAGRVAHFDFSTEYEVKITEEFLEYLKREEMPIMICATDGNEKPLATCALPLREALLNANQRVDLSLGLVAGLNSITSNVSDASDELGVLDLWCMLRAEPKHLASIKRTSTNSGTSMLNPQQEKLAQIMDDDLSNNNRMSQDLDIHLKKQKIDATTISTDIGEDRENKNYFYIPEQPTNETATPLGVQRSARYRSKHGGPSITSDLGMTSFETRQIMTRPPLVTSDRAEVGSEIIKNQENAKIREIKDDWNKNKEISFASFAEFEKKDKNRRPTTLSDANATNIIDNAEMNEARKNDSWKDSQAQTPVKEYEAPKDIQMFNEFMSSQKKYRDNSFQSDAGKKVTIHPNYTGGLSLERNSSTAGNEDQTLAITVLWLALNEECDAMLDPTVRRLYVAYSFLGRDGADLETPVSLPKPKHYVDKCYYNFRKTFHLTEFDMPILEHMAKCRSQSRIVHNSKDCIVFTVVSEPPEDPLGLENCVDIGHAFLYLGDLLSYCAGDSFTEVLPVRAARSRGVCGVLAVRLDGLDVVRARLVLP